MTVSNFSREIISSPPEEITCTGNECVPDPSTFTREVPDLYEQLLTSDMYLSAIGSQIVKWSMTRSERMCKIPFNCVQGPAPTSITLPSYIPCAMQ